MNMKRFLLSILCCLLAVVSGYAEDKNYSYTFTSKQFSENGTKTLNNVDWTLSGDGDYWGYDSNNGTKGQQFGSGSKPYKSLTLSTTGIEGTITKIQINTSGANDVNAYFTVSVDNTQYGSSQTLTTTATNYTFTGTSSGEIKFQFTQTSSKALYIKSINITYVSDSSEPTVLPSPEFTPAECEFIDSQEVTITAEDGAIFYTLDGTTPTKESEEYTGVITLTETTTVKAIAVKDGYKDSEVVEATYTKRVFQEGQVEDVLTREWTGIKKGATTYSSWSDLTSTSSAKYSGNSAGSNDAIQLRSNNSNSGIVTTVSGGKVKKIIVEWHSGTANGRTLDIYGKNTAYTAPTDLYSSSKQGTKLGSIVKGSSTELEITSDYTYVGLHSNSGAMYLTSITIIWETNTTPPPTAPAAPTITFDGNEGSIVVTIETAAGTTAYYTLNGNDPDSNSDVCPVNLTLKADATLKVIAYDDASENASSVVEQKFKLQSNGAAGTATLVTDVTELAVDDQVIIVASNSNVALSTNQKSSNRDQVEITKNGDDVELVDDVQILTLKAGTAENSFAFYTGSGYLFSASSSDNLLKTQATCDKNSSWGITIDANGIATIKTKGDYTRNWLRYNSTYYLFACYSSGQADVSLYKVNPATVEPYVLNVSAAGWATLFLDYNAEIPEGVTCYVISKFGAETIQLKEVTDAVPANTAVIVEAAEGAYTFNVADEAADVESDMTGTTKNAYITEDAYVLSIVDGEVGLYKAQMAGGVFLNNANKAYLPASALTASAQGASGFKFRFDNQTTGIEGAPALNTAKAIYDLSGRKVNDITAPGLYIVNGKKVMVK